jgi:hypothetical protein
MAPETLQPCPVSDGLQVSNLTMLQHWAMFAQAEMRCTESEDLIPATEEDILVYIVDCPSLHLVNGTSLSPPVYLRSGNVSSFSISVR